MDGFDRDGLHFDVTDVGPGSTPAPVVLCLHGFPQDRSAFDPVADRLAVRGIRVLAPDQRGCSPQARPATRRAYVLAELVADAVALLDAAGAGRAHVVGHDWGGIVAWALAAAHPHRVVSLTVLSQPHPAAMSRAFLRSSQALRSWYAVAFQVPVLPELLLTRGGGRLLARALVRSGLPDDLAHRYGERGAEGGRLAAGIGWYRALPFADRVGPVDVPVTYLHGWQDPFYSRASVLGTAEHVTGRFVRRTLDTGHWIPELAPGAVVDAVLQHVSRGVGLPGPG